MLRSALFACHFQTAKGSHVSLGPARAAARLSDLLVAEFSPPAALPMADGPTIRDSQR
jgi:hypothetical protein